MLKTEKAYYANGSLAPLQSVDLTEGAEYTMAFRTQPQQSDEGKPRRQEPLPSWSSALSACVVSQPQVRAPLE